MAQTVQLKSEKGFAVIEFDQPDAKVNVLSASSLAELDRFISDLAQREGLKGVCIRSGKPDIFIAGADIAEIEKIASESEARMKARAGQKIFNALEALPVPSIALINGVCLGGGLELALACDYRLTTFSDKVRLGLPEVKLGVIPGFGGTKRLPRLVGLRKGLEMIVSGETVSGPEAYKIGLVDGLAGQEHLLEEGMAFLNRKGGKRKQCRPRLKGRLAAFLDKTLPGRMILEDQARKSVLKNTRGHYPAALAAVEVVAKNYVSSLPQALAREAQSFGELAVGAVSKNLISVFYLVEKYKKAAWVTAAPRRVKKCGLLGAGIMGGGIAQLFSSYGFLVRMKDLNYQALGRGLRQARDVYQYAVKKKKMRKSQADAGMGLISPATTYDGFSNADLIIEAVLEDMKVKKSVWNEVAAVASPEAILASNTSCLSVGEMTEGVDHRDRVAGMHFFNPVHRMPLVEVIRASATSDETVATVVALCKKIGKTPIVVKDSCGFLVNRILLPYMTEAGFLLEEGADFERVDELCLDFGWPMGPLALTDEIGLDVGYKVALVLEEHFGARMKVPGILRHVYERKWFGKKSGKGFYFYRGKEKRPNDDINKLMVRRRATALDDETILNRMLFRMINEAAACLQEQVCAEASDVDIGMMMGTGFPPFRGGLLRYADSVGCDKIVAGLEKFKGQFDAERFSVNSYLAELGRGKRGFYK